MRLTRVIVKYMKREMKATGNICEDGKRETKNF